jgi:subtilase family serine protease
VPNTSRRAAVALAAALSLGGAVTVGQSATASPTSATWVATATKAVAFTGPQLGALSPARTLHLQIALTPRNTAAMDAATRALYRRGSSSYHHYLTPAQWRARYAPSTAAVAKVTSYLHAQGMRAVHVSGNRLLVSATATAAQAERAFDTTLVNFALGADTVYGNTRPARVPTALAGVVTAVIGLNNAPLTAIHTTAVPAKTGDPSLETGLTPKQFQATYDAKGTRTGNGISIAIVTSGATRPTIDSLRIAERKEHMKRVPVTVVKTGAQQPTDTSGADEFDMDSQTSTGVAGSVKRLYMYNMGQLVNADLDAAFTKFVSDDKATAISASIGGCEISAYLDGSEVAMDVVAQEAALQGQSLFASSGDNGDACMYVAAIGAPVGAPGVNWPASGEFFTAVGGTSLITDAKGHRIQELGWAGSGGGISYVENPGFWAAHTDAAYDASFVSGGRAVPDISLDADPNVATPAIVYVGKEIMYVGGTSLSSPLMLGLWARLEAAHHNKLGLASIPLYQVYDTVNPGTTITNPVIGLPVIVPAAAPKPVPGYYDITVGTNGVYPDTPGYDLVTGLGAPDIKQLTKVIGKK